MRIDNWKKEIYKFEKKCKFEKTSKKQLIRWLEKEEKNYKKARTKKDKENKLIDIIILVLQIARRENISLDKAYANWKIKSQKYIRK